MARDYEITAHGDSALLVTFGEHIDPVINARVHALAAAIRESGGHWSVPTPAYASLLVRYDALKVDFDAARSLLAGLVDALPAEVKREQRRPRNDRNQGSVRRGRRLRSRRCGRALRPDASTGGRGAFVGRLPGVHAGLLAGLRLPRRATGRARTASARHAAPTRTRRECGHRRPPNRCLSAKHPGRLAPDRPNGRRCMGSVSRAARSDHGGRRCPFRAGCLR